MRRTTKEQPLRSTSPRSSDAQRLRVTVKLPETIIERARNAVAATAGLTLVALVTLLNSGLGELPSVGGEPISLQRCLGAVMAPLNFELPYEGTANASTEGRALTWSIANRPSWAAFNTTTGALTGTPSAVAVNRVIAPAVSAAPAPWKA